MRRCKICGVPLEGVLGRFAQKVFRVRVSIGNPDICSKCEKPEIKPQEINSDALSKGKYRCQICKREVDEAVALTHIKTEEYLIDLIKKDHPLWQKQKSTCQECIDYYRRLVKDAEI